MSGEGARLFGGQWNSPGVRAVYLGDSLALAGMELLVHLGDLDVLRTYRKLPVTIPEVGDAHRSGRIAGRMGDVTTHRDSHDW